MNCYEAIIMGRTQWGDTNTASLKFLKKRLRHFLDDIMCSRRRGMDAILPGAPKVLTTERL
jgi:hypothetical protein